MDVQRIASQFVKQEEENFALFNYVNELNHEIESLNATMMDLKEKIGTNKISYINRAILEMVVVPVSQKQGYRVLEFFYKYLCF